MEQILDSSSDDDTYINSVARLREMKMKRLQEKPPACDKDVLHIEITDDTTNNIDDIRTVQAVTRKQKRTLRSIDRTKPIVVSLKEKHSLTNDQILDVEIVSIQKPESYKNDGIVLSSDNEDITCEDENYEMTVKVLWRSNRIDRLGIRKYDSFQKIFQYYANLEKISINKILLMKKDKIINHTDTPASLNLCVIDILDGGIIQSDTNILFENKNRSNTKDDTVCNIKIQMANKKQPLVIPYKKDQQFKILFANCAEQLCVNETNLKFYFDGDQINSTDTPQALDFEEEACIDLHVAST